MELNSINILGNSSIGIFGIATDTYSIFPNNIKRSYLSLIKDVLNVPYISTSISSSHLIGLFTVGNSNNLLVPGLTNDDEIVDLQNHLDGIAIHILDSKITALGNAIVCTNNVALVHPEFTIHEKKDIADFLDVEVESKYFLNSPLVGSMIFRNAHGLLTHPLMPEDDIRWLSDFFKVQGDVVTVNRGTPFPRPGIIANVNGVLVGSDTSGPELMRIYEVLVSK